MKKNIFKKALALSLCGLVMSANIMPASAASYSDTFTILGDDGWERSDTTLTRDDKEYTAMTVIKKNSYGKNRYSSSLCATCYAISYRTHKEEIHGPYKVNVWSGQTNNPRIHDEYADFTIRLVDIIATTDGFTGRIVR